MTSIPIFALAIIFLLIPHTHAAPTPRLALRTTIRSGTPCPRAGTYPADDTPQHGYPYVPGHHPVEFVDPDSAQPDATAPDDAAPPAPGASYTTDYSLPTTELAAGDVSPPDPVHTPCPTSHEPHGQSYSQTSPASASAPGHSDTSPVDRHDNWETAPASEPTAQQPATTAAQQPATPAEQQPLAASPSPLAGTASLTADGSAVAAQGDNSVSVAADKTSGSASANGETGSLAVAGPGAALGIGTSARSYNAYGRGSRGDASPPGVGDAAAPLPEQQPAPAYAASSPVPAYEPVTAGVAEEPVAVEPMRTPCPGTYSTGYSATSPATEAYSETSPASGPSGQAAGEAAAPGDAAPATGVPETGSPSASPRPNGTAAISTDGSAVAAEGDNTVSVAADKESGSASANGESGSLAAAGPGAAVAIGTSERMGAAPCGSTLGNEAVPVEYHAGAGEAPGHGDAGYGYAGAQPVDVMPSATPVEADYYVDDAAPAAVVPTHTPCGHAAPVGYSATAPTGVTEDTWAVGGAPGEVWVPDAEAGVEPAVVPEMQADAASTRAPVAVQAEDVPTRVPVAASASPMPNGTAALAEDGSGVVAEGDNSVSVAADKTSGSAAANAETGSLAGAGPGAAVGIGSSER